FPSSARTVALSLCKSCARILVSLSAMMSLLSGWLAGQKGCQMPAPSSLVSTVVEPSALTWLRPFSASHHALCHQFPPERHESTDRMVTVSDAACRALMNTSAGPDDEQAAIEMNGVPPRDAPSAFLMMVPNRVAWLVVDTMSFASPGSMCP